MNKYSFHILHLYFFYFETAPFFCFFKKNYYFKKQRPLRPQLSEGADRFRQAVPSRGGLVPEALPAQRSLALRGADGPLRRGGGTAAVHVRNAAQRLSGASRRAVPALLPAGGHRPLRTDALRRAGAAAPWNLNLEAEFGG